MSLMKAQVDRLLTGVSMGLKPGGMLTERILPTIKHAQYTGLLGAYGLNHLRIENSNKGGRGRYRRVETTASTTKSFHIEGHGLEGFVSKEDYANKIEPFDAEADEVMGLESMLILEKEKTLADTLSNTSIITQNSTLAGSAQFSDFTNSDPIAVFKDIRKTIRAGCGVRPNKAVMDYDVFDTLRYHPSMLDALGFKENRPGGLNVQELASAVGVDELLVAEDCMYNNSKEGQADALTPVWGKHIIFLRTPDKADKMQVSAGYLVVPEGSTPRKVYKQPNFNPPGSTSILCEDEYDMLLSNAGAVYLLKNAIA